MQTITNLVGLTADIVLPASEGKITLNKVAPTATPQPVSTPVVPQRVTAPSALRPVIPTPAQNLEIETTDELSWDDGDLAGQFADESFAIHTKKENDSTPSLLFKNKGILRGCRDEQAEASFDATPPAAPTTSPVPQMPLIPKGPYDRLGPAATAHNRRARYENRTGVARDATPEGMQSTRPEVGTTTNEETS